MEKRRKNIINGTISMDNALINAAQGLLLSEKRILMFALTKKPSINNKIDDPIKIEAKAFATIFNIESHTAYEQIKMACESIIKKQVSWHEKNGTRTIQINWVSWAEYVPQSGFVEIAFTPKIQKYLSKLTKHFTTYQLQQATALRSIHSWRLLELLTQFQSTGWREISIEKFTTAMEATEKQKMNFAKIREKIIEPSVRELEEKNGWKITWHAIKTCRKVTALFFKFQKTHL